MLYESYEAAAVIGVKRTGNATEPVGVFFVSDGLPKG
jgi:hypothetical protein